MKQTAVELIFDELHDKGLWSSKMEKIFEQAKEMEKEQIEDAYMIGYTNCEVGIKYRKQYYNETFKSE
jgi:hypothetical protein